MRRKDEANAGPVLAVSCSGLGGQLFREQETPKQKRPVGIKGNKKSKKEESGRVDDDQRRSALQIPRRRWCVERVLGMVLAIVRVYASFIELKRG